MSKRITTLNLDSRIRVTVPKLRLLFAGFAMLVAGCADDPSTLRDPGAEQRSLQCGGDATLACFEKLGKTVSCSCSSRDELRRILEPERH
jgi:hypothetical protein